MHVQELTVKEIYVHVCNYIFACLQTIRWLLVIKPLLIIQATTKPLSNQKRPFPEKRDMNTKKTILTTAKTEANAQPVARETPAEHTTPSWASDHNYNAVKPERTPAISSSLLFKCMYRIGIFLNNHLHFFWIPIHSRLCKTREFRIYFFLDMAPNHFPPPSKIHTQRCTQMGDTCRSSTCIV